jgi:hypothetical protein
MSDSGFTFNNNVTGNGANIAQGQTVSQTVTQNFGREVPEPKEVFEAIAAELPPDVAEDTVEPLQTFATMPIVQMEAPEAKSKWSNLLERLVPFAPAIGKGLATFGAAALESLASRNPIVAGVLALCKANSPQ